MGQRGTKIQHKNALHRNLLYKKFSQWDCFDREQLVCADGKWEGRNGLGFRGNEWSFRGMGGASRGNGRYVVMWR